MKVFHLITTMEPGGAEKQLMHLAQEQALSDDTVYIAFLKGNGTLKKQIAETKIQLIESLANKPIFVQYFLLWKMIKHIKPDVVHCHLPRSESLGALLKSVSNVKLILTKHNSERFWPTGITILSRILASFVNDKANAIICISNATKKYLQSIGELEKDNKVVVVHYGVPPSQDLDAHGKHFSNSMKIKLLTFSRLVPQKNLTNLISAMAILCSIQRDSNLLIYGEGKLRDQLQKQIEELNLVDHVKILSPVLHSDEILANCDIFLLTSHYEGFGLSVLEALRSNRPVIASNKGALKEVLGHGYPYLVDPLNPQEIAAMILRVWSDLNSCNVPNLEKIVDRFSIKKKALEIARIYRLDFQYV